MPKFDWHKKKNRSNLKEHHVNFETGSKIWDGMVFEQEDDREDYGEERITAFGMVDNRILAVTYTDRDGVFRLISARKATTEERKAYEEEFKAHAGGD